MHHVNFTQMKDGTREEYEFLDKHEREYAAGTADRLLAALESLDDSLSGYQVTRLAHSLQSATRALHDGADIDWIVSALLHDIGDLHAPFNHDEYAAAVLRPFVREQCSWVVEKHGEFQTYYYAHHTGGNRNKREQYAAHIYFDDCVAFCERWDQSSFDPAYPSKPLSFFAPMVRKVFARDPFNPSVIRTGEREPLIGH